MRKRPEQEQQRVYFNRAQLRVMRIRAQINVLIWGRRTGKSTGALAPWTVNNAYTMPRSNGGLISISYQKFLANVLPNLIMGWERMGYKMNEHYVIGKSAPKEWRHPYFYPQSPDYLIHWRNGSGQMIISQDRPASANGISMDYLGGDEARFLNKQKLDEETIPALSGTPPGKIRKHWKRLAQFKGIMYCTDMPTNSNGAWLIEYEKMMDPQLIRYILHLQRKENDLLQKHYNSGSPSYQRKVLTELNKVQEKLRVARLGSVHYSEASTFENIKILGPEYFELMRKVLPHHVLLRSVLNIRQRKIEDGFYSDWDQNLHGYYAPNNTYLEGLNYELDRLLRMTCAQDADIRMDKPLEVALDYGNRINCVVTGQEYAGVYKVLKSMHVLAPRKLRDLAAMWSDYYSSMLHRNVIYYYDHTAIGRDGKTHDTYASIWSDSLRSLGWNVQDVNIGKGPTHNDLYNFWSELLRGHNTQYPIFRYNIHNNTDLEISVENAPAEDRGDGVKKIKTSEHDPNVPDEHATDYSEALDKLLWGHIKFGPNTARGIYDTAAA